MQRINELPQVVDIYAYAGDDLVLKCTADEDVTNWDILAQVKGATVVFAFDFAVTDGPAGEFTLTIPGSEIVIGLPGPLRYDVELLDPDTSGLIDTLWRGAFNIHDDVSRRP